MMSSAYLTRVLRQPLRAWRWPRREHLLERVFRRGPPPFDPFPSIQDVIDAVLCPVTVVHKMYHGLHGALSGPREVAEKIGSHFHRFVSILKSDIALGRRRPDEAFGLLKMYCSREGLDYNSEENLKRYLKYWLRRKKSSLDELWGQGPGIFHEVHVSTINATWEERGVRYPIHGVIDEIDTINKRIVERTIRGNENDPNPPFLEDFQVWLQWKVLTSINRDLLPDVLRNEDFQDYDLIVETPHKDFTIEKNKPLFEKWAEDALAWISDIARSSVAIGDAWQNRGHHNRPCSFRNEVEECSLDWACYSHRWRYPERRSALRASLRPIYRALYYEQVWVHDLLLYQLTKMEQDADPNLRGELRRFLIGRKIYPLETVENIGSNKYRVKIDERVKVSLAEEVQDESLGFEVIFGSFSVGLRRRAYLLLDERETEPEDGRYVVYIEGMDGTEGMNAFLLKGLLLKEDPWFLKQVVQRAVFSLERWGVDREERAKNHVLIKLIDTLFGPGTLRAKRR